MLSSDFSVKEFNKYAENAEEKITNIQEIFAIIKNNIHRNSVDDT